LICVQMSEAGLCPVQVGDLVSSKSSPHFIGLVHAIENQKAVVFPLTDKDIIPAHNQLVTISKETSIWKHYNGLDGEPCIKNQSDFKRACKLMQETVIPWCRGVANDSRFATYEDALVGFVQGLMVELRLSMKDACAESRRVFSATDDIEELITKRQQQD